MDERLLTKIAVLYYLDGHGQREIGHRLGISTATVSRALERARKKGIVDIKINNNYSGNSKLETELEEYFGLQECIIVPDFTEERNTKQALGHELSQWLLRIADGDSVIGVSWGNTLYGCVNNMPQVELSPSLRIVPMIGGLGNKSTPFYTNSIASVMAEKTGGVGYVLNAPAILSTSDSRQAFETENHIQDIHKLWKEIDIALVSISGVTEDSSLVRYELLSKEELQQLQTDGAFGAINFNFFSRDGRPVSTSLDQRIINIGWDQLDSIRQLAVLAFGGKKIEPIAAYCSNGRSPVLFTDLSTALGLKEYCSR
ncbi:MAG: sugar-binding transcriptional regulator [Spirochaetales bacterium]|nr:sugar-binding transcriptional regulator [Spirochaetales bacterium]MCF7937468.1 sugar-binding transcriptional regulator [Spirochaetales bacterium]